MTRYDAARPTAALLTSATLICATLLSATLLSATLLSVTRVCAQQPGIQRKTLLRHDGAPGYQIIVNIIEFAPGAHEIRHTHPGTLSGYVLEGTLTLEHEGRPAATYKAGEAFYVEAGKVHVGSNETAAPVKMIATLVLETGKPPSSPAP